MTNPDDGAYPSGGYVSRCFTKREIVLKDFMCELIPKGGYLDHAIKEYSEKLAKQASVLTEAYFNELNKQQ